jgi:hypothetical protein
MKPLRSALILLAAICAALAQHAHVNAGLVATPGGERLGWVNGARFDAASGRFFWLGAGTNALGALQYQGAGPSLTALPVSPELGGPVPGHAAPGARLVARVVSVAGPPGGEFLFWEAGAGGPAAPDGCVTVGETAGALEFVLSENTGLPGEDPYGHIHGRRFGATRPGLYRVGLQVRDSSTNGPAGGPLHAPAAAAVFLFQAGLTIAEAVRVEGGLRLTFAARAGETYRVEAAAEPAGAWTPVGDALAGNDRLLSVTAPLAGSAACFRLRLE